MTNMANRLLIAAALSATVSLAGTGPAFADNNDHQSDNTIKADNSKMNEMRENRNLTADQQGENQADRTMTREIRRAIEKDSSLSTYGHNVKIITRDGMVTLKGPVRSEKERHAIGKEAIRVAGKRRVANHLDVVPAEKK